MCLGPKGRWLVQATDEGIKIKKGELHLKVVLQSIDTLSMETGAQGPMQG